MFLGAYQLINILCGDSLDSRTFLNIIHLLDFVGWSDQGWSCVITPSIGNDLVLKGKRRKVFSEFRDQLLGSICNWLRLPLNKNLVNRMTLNQEMAESQDLYGLQNWLIIHKN